MRNVVLRFGAAALALSLAACSETDQPENNIVAEDLNTMTNLEEMPPVAPAANVAVEETVTEARQSEPAATKPVPAKPAPEKPKPTLTEPKPEPAAEPKPSDPACAPEHRAAGHC
jgi:outer membrane biosynthesis protein TonB